MKNSKESISKYNFTFNIGQKVKVKELNIKGKITGIYISPNSIEYNVRYFFNSEAKICYFDSYELEPLNEGDDTVGFKT